MNQVQNLQHIARELLYLGMDGSPIYTDHFRQLNTEVFRLSEALFSMKGTTSDVVPFIEKRASDKRKTSVFS